MGFNLSMPTGVAPVGFCFDERLSFVEFHGFAEPVLVDSAAAAKFADIVGIFHQRLVFLPVALMKMQVRQIA